MENSLHIGSALGIIFTDYHDRVRVEQVKYLLQYTHLRVGEITFAAGFELLSSFLSADHRSLAGAFSRALMTTAGCREGGPHKGDGCYDCICWSNKKPLATVVTKGLKLASRRGFEPLLPG